MKVLIFNSLYYPYRIGGAEKSVQLLAETLVLYGNTVTVATLHEGKGIKEELINGVRIVRFPLKNIYWINEKGKKSISKFIWHVIDINNFLMKYIVKRQFEGEEFDIVHTNNLAGFSVSIWTWCKQKRIKIIHTTRDYYLLNPNGTLFCNGENTSPEEFKAYAFSWLKKKKSQKVDAVIGISNYISSLHENHNYFKNAKSYVIYNPIPIIGKPSKVINKRSIVLGFIGRVEKAKGIEYFLDEMIAVKRSIVIKVAGKAEESYMAYLQNKYKCLNVEFLGLVDTEKFFPTLDYTVVPSIWNEPLGRVVIESYAYGIPVLGSCRGGIAEIIRHGETGFLFNIESAGALTTLVETLPDSCCPEYIRLSERANNFSKQFTQENIMNNYVKAYCEVIENTNKIQQN
ncbi:TPA: glycosyltransferase family 4 protein [Klebsiella quasipneumoniae]|uniref:Glycosyltransferase n=1 Tax=Klebsiella pneumoniae TaxID=573 RepID=A0A1C3SZR6_KLEPN|nr:MULTISPECIES: glycosyltransferase family 4 protein [Klebsiella]MBE8826501.1 glycosyltransferase family 4 protein [Klebsiella quasipneumoniae]MRE82810.1 glycosyltransferase [Klebsiella quasipneumoniae]UJA26825.1 glycosyltransferase family 4 protein [Klebsiella pneumoniae]SCA96096.1 glycosyltransferase [Klebsiella pneumoniae]